MKPLMKYHVDFTLPDGRTVKSWGVFPIGQTNILDGIYNPVDKVLQLYLDSTIERYHDVEVQDPKTHKYSVQSRKLSSYYRFLLKEEDLSFFLDTYVENNFDIEPEITDKKLIVNA